mmetsp:Transcript_23466/g.32832  ORF Transcript_23466/g.32832 Transcript_23466/m.32832 type:complete len:80 (-) Transcript_23466:717-956(-)
MKSKSLLYASPAINIQHTEWKIMKQQMSYNRELDFFKATPAKTSIVWSLKPKLKACFECNVFSPAACMSSMNVLGVRPP